MANKDVTILSKTGINGLSAASTLITTTENGTERFYPHNILIVLTAIAGTLLSVVTVSVGTNSSSYDNIMPSTLLTGLSLLNTVYRVSISGAFSSVDVNTGIYLKVVSVATGATTYTIKTIIYGDYQ